MPKFIASIEVWFEADSLRDAERVADGFGDVIADNSQEIVTSGIATGVAPEVQS